MNNAFYIAGDRNKGKQGLVSNYIYYMKCMKEWDRKLFYGMIFVALPMTIATLLQTLLPSVLVQGLEDRLPVGSILLRIGLLSVTLWVFNTVAGVIREYGYTQEGYLSLHFMKKYVAKIMDVDYGKLDEEEFRRISENVWNAGLTGRGINSAMELLPEFTVNLLSVGVYGVLLGMQNVLLVAAVMVSLGLNLYLLGIARKKHREYFGRISKYAKRAEYITIQSMDSAAGKDIRIYKMLDWFLKKYDNALENIGNLYGNIHKWYLVRNVSGAFLELLRDGVAFGILVYFLVNGRITAAAFVFCIGAVSRFSQCFEMTLRVIMDFNSVNTSIGYVRDFLETESQWEQGQSLGEERMEELRRKPAEVTLKDVFFSYPGGREILSGVNLTIRPGEKLALIGLNGAGKTTLVKLICGFYQPTKGEILMNGIPIRAYSREEYYSLVAVLFQDSTLLPATLDENLTGIWNLDGRSAGLERGDFGGAVPEKNRSGESVKGPRGAESGIDRKRLEKALEFSGFAEKYESLDKKGESRLVKKINEGAVDFSGGEMQKLLFARALYKEAPLVILDEPTAALDPIAENELYEHYGASMEGKTSIYISHRLSSTRFCDRIVLLEGGRIVEEGTHESLLAAGGRYTRLYEMQSQYYQDQEEIRKRMEAMGDEISTEQETRRGIFDEAR